MEIKSINYQTDTGFTLFQKNKNQANLEAIAEEFESMFINQMLKNARDSKLSEALFSSDEEDNFGAMLDQERSRSLALNLDLGIAEALVRQFDKKNKEYGDPFAPILPGSEPMADPDNAFPTLPTPF